MIQKLKYITSDITSDDFKWFQRVGSSVPRGFSRYFILELLKKNPHTGKEIIDYAVEQSNGIWKPSPGLIYPLLRKIVR